MNSSFIYSSIKYLCLWQILLNFYCVAEKTCHSKQGTFPPTDFGYFSCAWCYEFLFSTKQIKILFAHDNFYHLYNAIENTLILPDIHNQSNVNIVCSTLDSDECTRWQSCCIAAEACCESQISNPPGDANTTCSRTWDGWGCWEDAVPGEVVYQSCPLFLTFSVPSRDAVKTCLSNASWERKDGSEWTNYQPCLTMDDLKTSLHLGFACSVVSIVLLFPAIIIFIKYKALRKQHRIRLHINFFISLLLKEIAVALWDMLVTYERVTNREASTTVLAQNGPGCKVLSFIKIYSKSASFTWMFCEGFYLHRLMSDAFSPPRTLIPLYVSGWIVPFVSTFTYAILRLLYANESCWSTSYKHFEWIFDAPSLACLFVNLIFLCNILRILLTQIQSHPNEPSHFRRAVKATFVLLPLFGVQLFVTIYRVPTEAPGGLEYERFSIVVNNLQGFCVALIFCFLNHEVSSHIQLYSGFNKLVIANLRRTWRRRVRDRDHSHSRRADFTSMNATYTSRADTDFNYVNKPLCDNTTRNGDRHVMVDDNTNHPLNDKRPNVASDTAFC